MRVIIEDILKKLESENLKNNRQLMADFIFEKQEEIEFKIQEMWQEYQLRRQEEMQKE